MIYVRSKLNPTAITIIFLLKGLHEKSKHKAGGVSPRNYKKWNCEPMKMAASPGVANCWHGRRSCSVARIGGLENVILKYLGLAPQKL